MRSLGDSADFFNHLKLVGFEPQVIIDVGVANGTQEIYDAFPDTYYLLIDPVVEYAPVITKIMSKLNGEYIPCAVSDTQGEAEMMVQEPFYVSSLQFDDSLRSEARRVVKVDTLENIIQSRSLSGPIMIKTDCQGHDLNVIEGIGSQLSKIEVIICEIPLFGPWGGGPELTEYIIRLDRLGYRMYDIWGWLLRPGDQRLQHIDLVFVKTNGRLRQNKLFAEGPHNLQYFSMQEKSLE